MTDTPDFALTASTAITPEIESVLVYSDTFTVNPDPNVLWSGDCSTYQGIYVRAFSSSAGYSVDVTFFADAALTHQLNDKSWDVANGDGLDWDIPVCGPYARVQVFAALNTQIFDVIVLGLRGPIPPSGLRSGGLLVGVYNAPIAGANSFSWGIPSYRGPVSVSVAGVSAKSYTIKIVSSAFVGTNMGMTLQVLVPTAGWWVGQVSLPPYVNTLVIGNLDAGAVNFYGAVVAL